MLGARWHNYATRENFENMVHFGAFWCIFLMKLYLEKLIYFYRKHNYYSYSSVMRLVIASGNFFGKTCHI